MHLTLPLSLTFPSYCVRTLRSSMIILSNVLENKFIHCAQRYPAFHKNEYIG